VLNGQEDMVRDVTRERVLVAARQLGYVRNAVAGSLRTDRTYVVALSIPDITNPFWPEVARGVQDTMEAEGYTTVIANSDWKRDREEKFLELVRSNRFDGLIINVVRTSADELARLKIPVVILGGGENHPTMDSIGSDTAGGTDAALQHLYELGHRRIGLISGLSRRKISVQRERYIAFHTRCQLTLDPALMVESDFTDQAGYQAMLQLLGQPAPPTAVLAANDTIAIGALKAAQALSWHVPDEISIIGMDDIYAAATTSPALTTVAKPKYEIGITAARVLMGRMAGEIQDSARSLKLPCELIVRGSTAPPRA
jgi:DNA-binding LacI/PurR family transcriptional regulator